VASCPYPLSSPMVAGKGTPGYGYEYYFDYPREKPLARFILLSAGLSGVDYNYSRKSPHTEWVEDKVASARDAGIPWVIAGVHKECITVGNDGHCPMGQCPSLPTVMHSLWTPAMTHGMPASRALATLSSTHSVCGDFRL